MGKRERVSPLPERKGAQSQREEQVIEEADEILPGIFQRGRTHIPIYEKSIMKITYWETWIPIVSLAILLGLTLGDVVGRAIFRHSITGTWANPVFEEENRAKGVTYIEVFAMNSFALHSTTKTIHSSTDVKGMSVITQPSAKAWVDAMGGNGVLMDLPDWYNSLKPAQLRPTTG